MLPYRQVHLDFHTSECVPGIGSKFDKEQFQNALKTGHVNSITIFAKCHHGWSYYPTKVNAMHPNLNFDLLGAQLEACKEINVKSPVYLSAGFDERMAREHGDWLIRHPDESCPIQRTLQHRDITGCAITLRIWISFWLKLRKSWFCIILAEFFWIFLQ